MGDEGGFAPHVKDPEETLKLLMEAIESAGHAGKISIGLDAAASEFYKDGKVSARQAHTHTHTHTHTHNERQTD